MAERYDPTKLEKKWQKRWQESGIYRSIEDPGKPKSYVLDMFPYPSGEGLHVGHPKGYIATDIYSRHMRMLGRTVLHPMGWDAFGLPAENYAIKTKTNPKIAVAKNIARYTEQLRMLGFDYDWSREINTTDPAFYKWTQWIFLKLYEKGLAFLANEPINWCPSCMTGLANEDLEGGVCERCGSAVEKKVLPQWTLRITRYADRMLDDLDALDWPEHIKELQRNWIGRSEGAEIEFPLAASDKKIKIFTTRPDTLFGATYLVLAPEHPLIPQLKERIENWEEVIRYVSQASAKTEIDRTAEGREKTGIELKGVRALNPAGREEIPVFVADYVLGNYGTGAIMAVPAHDERDYEFAQKFNLPILPVIAPVTGTPQENPEFRKSVVAIVLDKKAGKVLSINWGALGGNLFVGGGREEGEDPAAAAIREIAEETGYVDLKLLRQTQSIHHSYFAHSKNVARQIEAVGLLFELGGDVRREQKLEADEQGKFTVEWLPLAQVQQKVTDSLHKTVYDLLVLEHPYTGPGLLINSGRFDGMGSGEAKQKITEFAGGHMTTTYKLRDWVFSRQRYWGEPIPVVHCQKDGIVPVPEKDLPVLLPDVESYEPSGTGESPLATIAQWVNTACPRCGGPARRETNTMPQWAGSSWYYLRYMDPHNDTQLVAPEKERYWAPVDRYVGGAEHATRHLIYARFWHKFLYDIGVVSTLEPFMQLHSVGLIIAEDGRKMSKRFGNVINPDDIVKTYGADTLRVYEMFMGPFENAIAWNTNSLIGARRFIERVWRLADALSPEPIPALDPLLSATVKKVGDDIVAFKFNTAISQMMTCLNAAEKDGIGREQWEVFLRLLAPFAPHVTAELWARLGHEDSVHTAPWPQFDAAHLTPAAVKIGVQVNGKLRGAIAVTPDMNQEDALSAARAESGVAKWLAQGREVRAVYVPGKIISFVVDTV